MNGYQVIVIFCLSLFVFLAGYNITSPGLYYDELLFVNAALGGEADMFIYSRLGSIPIMLMPYIGALKAWIYYPIFEIFGVSAFSIRWPVILIGSLTLWLNYKYITIAFSRSVAIIFILLAAIEPSTIFHTRLDWGPTTLMMVFRALLLFTAFAWIRTGKPWLLFALLGISFLGVFDKLNFIWFVLAIFISLMLVYPDQVISFIKTHTRSFLFLEVIGVIGLALFLFAIKDQFSLNNNSSSFDLSSRLWYVVNMLKDTIGGAGVYSVVVGIDGVNEIRTLQLWVIGFVALAGMVIFSFTYRDFEFWKPLVFIFSVFTITLIQMFVTPQATGPHHAAMFAPLWLVPIAVFLESALKIGKVKGNILKGTALIAIISLSVSSLFIYSNYIKGFTGVVNPRWDSASTSLVQVISENENRPVICVDWGLCTIIYGLLDGEVKVYDNWPSFNNGLTESEITYYENNLLPQNPLFVVHAKGKETFKDTRINYFNVSIARNWDLKNMVTIKSQSGDALYEIYE